MIYTVLLIFMLMSLLISNEAAPQYGQMMGGGMGGYGGMGGSMMDGGMGGYGMRGSMMGGSMGGYGGMEDSMMGGMGYDMA
ncbi:hypothetical protein TELCIR_11604 [Teladorsagia circumcincta]|uniref:Uncharacterized protein n=1 Tax=Teladorsagia circumcincta TaxID=45464 RepID=A0A2G9U8Y5_TELCI|nr:hypothetical protein TELCIR_11604 [Teladorsagia circumcincta]